VTYCCNIFLWPIVAKILSNQEIKQEADGEASEKASAEAGEGQHTRTRGQQKIKGEFINWFVLDLWPPIMAIVKKHVNLKIAYKKPKVPSPYEKLGRASL